MNENRLTQFYLFLCIGTLYSQAAQAKEIVLYVDHKPVKNYEAIVETIKPEDTLIFTGNIRIKVGRELGGITDLIFEISGPNEWSGKVLRIAQKNLGSDWHERLKRSHINYFDQFKKGGLDVVEVFIPQSLPGEFTLAKKEDVQHTLDTYLAEKTTLSPDNPADQALLKFAKSAARFKSVSDFGPKQIAWTGEKWVLLDWGDGASTWDSAKDAVDATTVFQGWTDDTKIEEPISPDIYHHLVEAVQTERTHLRSQTVNPKSPDCVKAVHSVGELAAEVKVGSSIQTGSCTAR